MLEERLLADTMHCPSCQGELPDDARRCPHCGLALTAPQLRRVWQKSRQIADLIDLREKLIDEVRAEDAARERQEQQQEEAQEDPEPPSEPVEPLGDADVVLEQEDFADPATAVAVEEELGAPEPGVDARPDLAPPSARTALLFVGGILFTVSALVFTAVAWGGGGLALVVPLAATTAVMAGFSALAVGRRLAVTAEALAGLTVVLLLVDAYALRRAGAAPGWEGSTYWAVAITFIVLAVLPVTRRLRVIPRLSIGVLVQLPVPLLADSIGSTTVLALVLGCQALALVVIEARWGQAVEQASGRLGRSLRAVAGSGALLAGLYATVMALGVAAGLGGDGEDPRLAGSAVLLALSLVPWTAAFLHSSNPAVRHGGSGAATVLFLAGLVTGSSAVGVSGLWLAVFTACLTLGVAVLAGRLPRGVRPGPVTAASLVALGALAAVMLPLLTLLASPVLWWLSPWDAGMWQQGRRLLGPVLPVVGGDTSAALPGAFPAVVAAALVALTFALVARGMRPDPGEPASRRPTALLDLRHAGAAADVVGTAAVAAIPAALPLPHVLSVMIQLGVGGVLLLRPRVLTQQLSTSSRVAATLGGLVVALALSWSVATRGSTLVAFALAAGLLAAGAAFSPARERPSFAALSALVACAEAGALALAVGASLPVTAAAVALTAAVIGAAAGLLDRAARHGAETGAVVAYLVGLLAVGDAGAGGLIALAGAASAGVMATREDRRPFAAVSASQACLAAVLLAAAAGTGWTGAAYALAVTACAAALVGTYLLLPAGEVFGARPREDQLSEKERELQDRDRAARSVEIVGAIAYAAALAVRVPVWPLGELAILLAVGGATAAAVALRPHRRPVWRLAHALLTGSLWAALAVAGVELLELYTVPPAVALIAAGVLRRRAAPAMRSWRAYTGGLVLGLGPSLYAALTGDDLWRPLLLGIAALAITVVGARRRLQAPLTVGGVVLSIDAMFHAVPYAAGMPRWASIGAAGIALLALGATYDRRLRDLRRLQERLGELD